MSRDLVAIEGDPDPAAGLLAKSGIQSLIDGGSSEDRRATARLLADSPETAVERVRGALAGEPFAVGGEAVVDDEP